MSCRIDIYTGQNDRIVCLSSRGLVTNTFAEKSMYLTTFLLLTLAANSWNSLQVSSLMVSYTLRESTNQSRTQDAAGDVAVCVFRDGGPVQWVGQVRMCPHPTLL